MNKNVDGQLKILFRLFILPFFIFFNLFSTKSFSQRIEEKIFEAKSSFYNLEKARLQIFDQAIQEISLDSIKKFIGQDKIKSHKKVIQNKIIKHSKKYILYIKELENEKLSDGIKIKVLLKVSNESLKKLLLDEGLFYKEEGFLKVLPLISFEHKGEHKDESFTHLKWWSNEISHLRSTFLVNESQSFHRKLKDFLMEYGFFGLEPETKGFNHLIPPEIYSKRGKEEDFFLTLGRFFNSPIILTGHVVYFGNQESPVKKKILIEIKALQSNSGQVLGQLNRNFVLSEEDALDTKNGLSGLKAVYKSSIQDLFLQILNVWKRGAYNTHLLALSFNGKMTFQQWEKLRKDLPDKVNEIKNIRDRYYSVRNVTYEVDSTVNSKYLSKAIDQAYKNHILYRIKVSRVESSEIQFKISHE